MLNLNKCIKTKPKPKTNSHLLRTAHTVVHSCHTHSQHRTVLISFSLIIRTVIIDQMLSIEGEGKHHTTHQQPITEKTKQGTTLITLSGR